MATERTNSSKFHPTNYLRPRKDAYINKTEAIRNALHPSLGCLKCKKTKSPPTSSPNERDSQFFSQSRAMEESLNFRISTKLLSNFTDLRETKSFTSHGLSHSKPSSAQKTSSVSRGSTLSPKPKIHSSFSSLAVVPLWAKPTSKFSNGIELPNANSPLKLTSRNTDSAKSTASSYVIRDSDSNKNTPIRYKDDLFLNNKTPTSTPPSNLSSNAVPDVNFSLPQEEKMSVPKLRHIHRRHLIPNSSEQKNLRLVLPLRYLISRKYKCRPNAFYQSFIKDESKQRVSSADSEAQTLKSSMTASITHSSKLQTRKALIIYPNKKVRNEPIIRNDIRELHRSNIHSAFTSPPLLFDASFSEESQIRPSSSNFPNTIREPSRIDFFFPEPHFAKCSKQAWEKQKTIQSIYSKDLDEKCKRIIDSADIKSPRSRRSTYNNPSSAFSSSQRRRTTSAPARTSYAHTLKTPPSLSTTPNSISTVESAHRFHSYISHSVPHQIYSSVRRQHLFKGPHHFSLIPKRLNSAVNVDALHTPIFSEPSTTRKPLLLECIPDTNSHHNIKKRSKRFLRQTQNSFYNRSVCFIRPYVQLSNTTPISLSSTISRFYYISKVQANMQGKTIVTAVAPTFHLNRRSVLPTWLPFTPVLSKMKKEPKKRSSVQQEDIPFNLETLVLMEDESKQGEDTKEILIPIQESENVEEQIDIGKLVTEAFVPSISTFNKAQRVMFVQDFTMLTKWYEDVTTKNFVNNNMYSLEVDTRKIAEFSEDEFRRMVWNLYYYVIRIGQDMLMSPSYYNKIYGIITSEDNEDVKLKNCLSVIESIPKRMYLNLKSVFGHSFRLSKVAKNNKVFLGILYTTLGHVLFPGIRLPSPPTTPDPSKKPSFSSSKASIGVYTRRRSTISYSSELKASSSELLQNFSRRSTLSSSPSETVSLVNSPQIISEMDILNMSTREPIDTEMESTRLNEVKEIVGRVVSSILKGEPLKQQLSLEGFTFMYLVESFDELFSLSRV